MSAPDLLIIGGGAAGLSAAATAQGCGLSVDLVEERATFGGNYYAGAGETPFAGAPFGKDHAHGAALIAAARRADLAAETLAWRFEPDGRTFTLGAKGAVRPITPKRLLIATGAMERPVPLPGGLLPGVMYAGAAQLLMKTVGHVPAGRFVLVGSGPLLLLVAKQLLGFGLRPEAIVDTAARTGFADSLRSLPAALNAPDLIAKGLGLHRALRRAGVPWHHHASAIAIEGRNRAEAVCFTDAAGQRQRITTDLVLLHDGVVPNDQVSRQLACAEVWNPAQRCFNLVLSPWGETSRPGIFAAGDCTGIWGAKAAELSGQIAALEIAQQVGAMSRAERDRRAKAPLSALARQKRFRPFLERRFPPRLAPPAKAADDVVICRCEAITAGEIRLAIGQGATGPDQLKSFTRCGMGPCQGRSCALAVAEIIAQVTGQSHDEIGRHDLRAPLKPLPLGRIAAQPMAEVTP